MVHYFALMTFFLPILTWNFPSCIFLLPVLASVVSGVELFDGPTSYARGKELFEKGENYDAAAMELWKAVLLHGNTPPEKRYNVQEVFQLFMQCYMIQGKTADGFAFVASESFRRGQIEMGKNYLEQAFSIDPHNHLAKSVKNEFRAHTGQIAARDNTIQSNDDEDVNADLKGKSPEELYEIASTLFAEKKMEECADIFEIACLRSGNQLGPACANAVYCRTMIADYGFNGTQFQSDMDRISKLTEKEATMYRIDYAGMAMPDRFAWRRATSVHPHMVRPISSAAWYRASRA